MEKERHGEDPYIGRCMENCAGFGWRLRLRGRRVRKIETLRRFSTIRPVLFLSCFTSALSFMAQPFWAPVGLPGQAAPMKQVYANATRDTIYYCGRTNLDEVPPNFNPVLRYAIGQWDTLGYIYTPIIHSVALYHDTLFAGGAFTYLDLATAAEGIAYWANGAWHPYGDLQHAVWKLRVLDDTLYAVGSFAQADGQAAKGIARRQGGQWAAVGQPPPGEMNLVDVIKYQGRLVTVGNGYINGLRGIFQLIGDEWSVLGPGFVGGVSGAQCMAVYQDDLYVGGQISIPEGNAGQEIMRWDGTAFHPLGTGLQWQLGDLSSFSTCADLKVHDGLLWACGGFNYAGGVEAYGVATWDGMRWCGVPGVFAPEGVYAMDFYGDTLFVSCGGLAAGEFVNYGAKFIGDDYVDSCGAPVGIPDNTNSTPQLQIWLSALGELSIQGLLNGVHQLGLYDVTGKSLFRRSIHSTGTGTNRIPIPGLRSGVYILQIDGIYAGCLIEDR